MLVGKNDACAPAHGDTPSRLIKILVELVPLASSFDSISKSPPMGPAACVRCSPDAASDVRIFASGSDWAAAGNRKAREARALAPAPSIVAGCASSIRTSTLEAKG